MRTACNRRTSPDTWLSAAVCNLGEAVARDDDRAIAAHARRIGMLLAQRGSDFNALAARLERLGAEIEHQELQADAPIDYPTIRTLFDRHEDLIDLPATLWLGAVLRKLKRGELLSVDDRRQLADLRARLRLATHA